MKPDTVSSLKRRVQVANRRHAALAQSGCFKVVVL